jgi:hypothetical protein
MAFVKLWYHEEFLGWSNTVWDSLLIVGSTLISLPSIQFYYLEIVSSVTSVVLTTVALFATGGRLSRYQKVLAALYFACLALALLYSIQKQVSSILCAFELIYDPPYARTSFLFIRAVCGLFKKGILLLHIYTTLTQLSLRLLISRRTIAHTSRLMSS